MRYNKIICATAANLFIAMVTMSALTSCSDEESIQSSSEQNALFIDGTCNIYEVSNNEGASWTITETPAWITPVSERGNSGDTLKVYVESNSRSVREGEIKITYNDGHTRSVAVTQSNTQTAPSLQKTYAAGWSFDVRTYMDFRGIRGQVFNTQKLYAYDKDIYTMERDPGTIIQFFYGESGSDLANDMSAKLKIKGKYNAFSLDLQGTFGKSAMINSKRIFSKIRYVCREYKVYINQLDDIDAQTNNLFTVDFAAARQKVIDSNGSDEAIRDFINYYGTHFVKQAILGGLYDYYFSSVVENASDLLNVEAALKVGFAEKFNLTADANYKDDFNKLNKERIEKFSVKGGDAITMCMAVENGTICKKVTDAWLESLRDSKNYELISFELSSLSNLFPGDIATKINAYTDRMYYREIAVTRSAN